MHKSSDAEIATSPQMTNQIVIEGVVHSVCAGYRPHHGNLTEGSNNESSNNINNTVHNKVKSNMN